MRNVADHKGNLVPGALIRFLKQSKDILMRLRSLQSLRSLKRILSHRTSFELTRGMHPSHPNSALQHVFEAGKLRPSGAVARTHLE